MVHGLKRQTIHINILASAGGATAHGVFEEIVTSDERIRDFAAFAATFVKNHKLDGIDID